MATTFTKIASVSVGVLGAANIDFTSIPSTYTDLVIKLSGRSNAGGGGDWVGMKFNSSSTSYSSRWLEGTGSSAGSFTGATNRGWLGVMNGAGSTSSTFSSLDIYIPNYAGSNNKSYSADAAQEKNATAATLELGAGLWSDTSAITSISIIPDNSNSFVQYSTATLYGIKNS